MTSTERLVTEDFYKKHFEDMMREDADKDCGQVSMPLSPNASDSLGTLELKF